MIFKAFSRLIGVLWCLGLYLGTLWSESDIRLNYNENPFPVAPQVKAAILEDLEELGRYSGKETRTFLELLAEKHHVSRENILLTPGSGPLLEMAGMAWGKSERTMVTATPSYGQLTQSWRDHGGNILEIPLDEKLTLDLETMAAAVSESTDLVYICNPNNPTGTLLDPEELKAFIRALPDSVIIFVDEAYIALSEGGEGENSMVSLLAEEPNLVISRTFSKVYGLAGLRVGYGLMSPDLKKAMLPYYQGGPNRLGIAAAQSGLEDPSWVEANQEAFLRIRNNVTNQLDAWGLRYAPPHGNFGFFETGMPIADFRRTPARDYGILVGRPFPPYETWCRVSLGTEEEMQAFLAATAEVLALKP